MKVSLFSHADFAESYVREMSIIDEKPEDFYYINIRNIFYRVYTDYFPKLNFDLFEVLLCNLDYSNPQSYEQSLFLRFEFRNTTQKIISKTFQDNYFRVQNFLIRLRKNYGKFKINFKKTLRTRDKNIKVTPIDIIHNIILLFDKK